MAVELQIVQHLLVYDEVEEMDDGKVVVCF